MTDRAAGGIDHSHLGIHGGFKIVILSAARRPAEVARMMTMAILKGGRSGGRLGG